MIADLEIEGNQLKITESNEFGAELTLKNVYVYIILCMYILYYICIHVSIYIRIHKKEVQEKWMSIVALTTKTD